MNENQKLYSAVSKIAWGYIFLLVHININTIDLLPGFVGYAMMLYSLTLLKEKCKNIMLLRPLAMVLIIWSVFSWIQKSFGIQFLPFVTYIEFVVEIIQLYFNFQLLTDLSHLASEYQHEGQSLDKKIITRRNIYTVLLTVSFLTTTVPLLIFGDYTITKPEFLSVVIMILAFIMLITAFMIAHALFTLRKLFKENSTAVQDYESFSQSIENFSQPPENDSQNNRDTSQESE